MSFTTDLVETVQARLKDLGFYDDAIDGDAGHLTVAATVEFKRQHGFCNRPYPGPLTLAVMFSESARPAQSARSAKPSWYLEMEQHLDLHERTDNAELQAWLRSDGATLGDPAQLPWCGDVLQTAIANTLPDEPLPANSYLAMNWAKFGRPCGPAIGAILSFHNGDPRSIYGHVALYAREDSTAYHLLGGNQSNAVTLTRISKTRLRRGGMRRPVSYPFPTEGAVQRAATGSVSTNEW